MWIKKQFGLRVLLLLMVFVAHASAKPHFAKRLANADVKVVATWCPLLISIWYEENEMTAHEETHVGLLGKYWLYSRTTSISCRFFSKPSLPDEEMQSGIGKILGDPQDLESISK